MRQRSSNGIIGTETQQLANTGKHHFIEVTDASGAVKIFDNAHPEGIMKDDYLKSIEGYTKQTGVISGTKLYEGAKQVTQ